MPPSPIEDAVVGDSLVINCIATTHVAVNVNLLKFYWMEGGDNITNNDRITIQPTVYLDTVYVSSLQFDYLVVNDEGNYTCNVEFFDFTMSVTVTMDQPDCKCNVFVFLHMYDYAYIHNYITLLELTF